MSNGYLRPDEIKATKPIKATPPSSGFENHRAIILMRTNGQSLGGYLWNSVVANSGSESNQKIIERAIAQEMEVLKHLGLPSSYVDACRSLLVESGVYELTEAGLAIPSSRQPRQDESILDG